MTFKDRQKRRKARKRIVIELEIDEGASVDTLLKILAWSGLNAPPMPKLPVQGHPIQTTLYGFGFQGLDTMEEFYKFLRLILSSSALTTFVSTAALEAEGKLTQDDMAAMNRVASGLLDIFYPEGSDDEMIALQLRAIEKMLKPERWNLAKDDVKRVADLDHLRYGENVTSLAYGAEVYSIMSSISQFVVPKRSGDKMAPNTEVKLIDKNSRPGWDYDAKSYEWAKRNIRPQSTLQSSAVRAYLERHQGDENSIDKKSLEEHLRKTKKWAEQFKPGDDLPIGVGWLPIEGGDPLPVRVLANLDPWLLARF
jgi:hypothetical protein